MGCKNECPSGCSCAGIVISLVVAIVVGVLFYFGYIPFIVTAAWIAFGLGVMTLILLFVSLAIASGHRRSVLRECLCRRAKCLLIGAVGSIVLSIALVSITVVTSILITILVALGAFFLTLILLSLAGLIGCMICELCCER